MIIAINGSLGSGKSTIAKILKEKLGFEYISTGAWFRELAAQRGMSVVEFSITAENDPSIDKYIDDRLKSYSGAEGNYIIDSRMAPFFIKDAVKIRLVVSDEEGAARIFCDGTRATECFESKQQALEGYRRRTQSEKLRYLKSYGVDLEKEDAYDIVIDTTGKSPQEVANTILGYVSQLRK